MTLKAAIVYVQGSSGNFLSRVLSLSDETIPYTTIEHCTQQPTLKLGAQERFDLYNNWNSENWIRTEKQLALWYRCGTTDFFEYQQSELKLIAQFHPAEFYTENQRQVLWTNLHDWENIILIDWSDTSRERIMRLAKMKRPDLPHEQQILSTELSIFQHLKKSITDKITLQWEDLLEIGSFLSALDDLCHKLKIEVDFDLAIKLWSSWIAATQTLEKNECL